MKADEEKGKDVAGSDWVGEGQESVLDLAVTIQCLTG